MKKIMFDNHYGLEDAVLNGSKTMTRRIAKLRDRESISWLKDESGNIKVFAVGKPNNRLDNVGSIREIRPAYNRGEEVAIAERYIDIEWRNNPYIHRIPDLSCRGELNNSKGWCNKMFVKAAWMPHHIRIIDIKVERLQDISDEDCLKEGIYYDNPLPELADPNVYAFDVKGKKRSNRWWSPTPKIAFENLIKLMMGKDVWESNPWVFVYEFELIK